MAVDLLNARTLKLPASLRALPAVLRLATITGVCAASAALPNAHAQSPEVREYQIKAAFIYNFLKFVDWPRDALPDGSETINICVLRDDPFADALESIKGKTVKFRGWLMFDLDHVSEAINTKPAHPAKAPWRMTVWEIHPITAMEIVP